MTQAWMVQPWPWSLARPAPEISATPATKLAGKESMAAPSTAPPTVDSPAQALETLVTRAGAGDRDAFSALVEQLQRPLYYAALRLLHHPQDSRDVVQRAFLKAWTRLPELEDPRRFRSWLFSIALNLARNHLRDQGRRQYEPVQENTLVSQGRPSQHLEQQQRRQQLRQAMEALPERQREVVTLRIDAEMSFRDIGEAVGSTENSARVNYHHAMKRLKALMQGPQEQP